MYRLNSRIAVGIMISPLLILGFQKQVEAATYTLNNVTFLSGATVTGSFNYNGTSYSDIDLTYTQAPINAALFPTTTYNSSSSSLLVLSGSSSANLNLENTSNAQFLNLIFLSLLTGNLTAPVNLTLLSDEYNFTSPPSIGLVPNSTVVLSGYVTVSNTPGVPEPLSIMGTITAAMYGVVLRGRKGMSQKREKTQP